MDRMVECNLRRVDHALFGTVVTEQHPEPNQVSVVKESGILRFDRPSEVTPEIYDEVVKDASTFFPVKTWEERLEETEQI